MLLTSTPVNRIKLLYKAKLKSSTPMLSTCLFLQPSPVIVPTTPPGRFVLPPGYNDPYYDPYQVSMCVCVCVCVCEPLV